MEPVRVLVVDDSAIVRGFISKILKQSPLIEIVGSAFNGEVGVYYYKKYKPDVIILDIEMPVMDGIEALKQIKAFDKNAKVIICSTLSTKQADITMKAMSLGAADCIAKPEAKSEINTSQNFRETLVRMVLSLSNTPAPLTLETNAPAPSETAFSQRKNATEKETQALLREPDNLPAPKLAETATIRPFPVAYKKPKIIAIGSSTGGPQALFKVLKSLSGQVNVPIIITQHMPPTFTEMLAKHIELNTGLKAVEASDGTILENGQVYVAPGGKHMVFEQKNNQITVRLSDGPPENFCKPAVDPMFRSILGIYPNEVLGIILTGMGQDGLRGSQQLVNSGNILLAQDEASSIVWGMPGAVARAGLCHDILPLNDIGSRVLKVMNK